MISSWFSSSSSSFSSSFSCQLYSLFSGWGYNGSQSSFGGCKSNDVVSPSGSINPAVSAYIFAVSRPWLPCPKRHRKETVQHTRFTHKLSGGGSATGATGIGIGIDTSQTFPDFSDRGATTFGPEYIYLFCFILFHFILSYFIWFFPSCVQGSLEIYFPALTIHHAAHLSSLRLLSSLFLKFLFLISIRFLLSAIIFVASSARYYLFLLTCVCVCVFVCVFEHEGFG